MIQNCFKTCCSSGTDEVRDTSPHPDSSIPSYPRTMLLAVNKVTLIFQAVCIPVHAVAIALAIRIELALNLVLFMLEVSCLRMLPASTRYYT